MNKKRELIITEFLLTKDVYNGKGNVLKRSHFFIRFWYNFRTEQRVSRNLIDRAFPYMTLYKPLQVVYIKPKNGQNGCQETVYKSLR